MADDNGVLIELDGRGRASLARLGHPEHRRYLAHVDSDGTIVLTPAQVVPLPARLRETATRQRDLAMKSGLLGNWPDETDNVGSATGGVTGFGDPVPDDDSSQWTGRHHPDAWSYIPEYENPEGETP